MAASKFPFLHFVNRISPEAIRDNKLMFPAKFINKFKNIISDFVSLELPDGRMWNVGLEEEHANKMYLVGLGDFFRFYSITPGQIILFKYRDRIRFKVFICSSSSMEITYPAIPDTARPNPDPAPEPEIGTWDKMKRSKIIMSKRFESKAWDASERTKIAIERALDTNPSNLSTMVVMSYNRVNCGMTLPVRFTQRWGVKHFESATLKLYSEGSSDEWVGEWVGEWVVYMSESSMSNRMSINGWHRFRDENMLGVGDVCLFELVQPDEGEEFIGVRVFKGADR